MSDYLQLRDLLRAGVDDPRLDGTVDAVALWLAAGLTGSQAGVIRDALRYGYADDLARVTALADRCERTAGALRTLVAHVETTHPAARRRQRYRDARQR